MRIILLVLVFWLQAHLLSFAQENKVIAITIDGAIHPASAEYIQTGLDARSTLANQDIP